MAAQNIEAIHRLSPTQEGMLFHIIEQADGSVYFNQYTCELTGNIDQHTYREAWSFVQQRHQVLRTLFTWERRDEPLQIVRKTAELPFYYQDWSEQTATEQAQNLKRLLQLDRDRGFDLETAPLFRVRLIHLAPDTHRLVLSFSHLILDGWSMRSMLDEVSSVFEATLKNQDSALPIPADYSAYTSWLTAQNDRTSYDYWHTLLGDMTSPCLMLSQSLTETHAQQVFSECKLDQELSEQLRRLAKQWRITLNTLFVGAWGVLVSRYAQTDQVVFGATRTNRPAELAGIEHALGLFINTLPIRIDIDSNQSIHTFIRQVQDTQNKIQEVQHASLAMVQRQSGIEAHDGLFDSVVVFENFPQQAQTGTPPSYRSSNEEFIEFSHFPLALLVVPDEEIQLLLVHDSTRCDNAMAQRILHQVQHILSCWVSAPESTLADSCALPEAQLEQLLNDHNGTSVVRHRIESPPELVHKIIEQSPDHIAVVGRDAQGVMQRLTYFEFNQRADNLAQLITRAGPLRFVVIYAAKTIEAVVGVFAAFKSGAAYVPIDINTPVDRVQQILQDLRAQHELDQVRVLCSVESARDLNLDAHACIPIDAVFAAGSGATPTQSSNNAAGQATSARSTPSPEPDQLAYVIYTSGSTGLPKGVQITHRNLFNSTSARIEFYGAAPEAFLLLSSLATDSSVAGLFWTLCFGGTLVLPPDRAEQDMVSLGQLMLQERVTHLLCVPSLYQALLEHASDSAMSQMSLAIVAGESCPPDLVAQHEQALKDVALFNEYGPSEATVWASVSRLDNSHEAQVTIGRAISNTQLYVTDSKLNLLPEGVPGELLIAGENVSPGYWNDEQRTAQAFVTLPLLAERSVKAYRTGDRVRWRSDGQLEFVGRIDHQLKVRGFRVEPEDIESALRSIPAVRDAGAYLHPQTKQLLALVVLADDSTNEHEVLQQVRKKLPPHMVPSRLIGVDQIVKTPAGKIDRDALVAPSATWNSVAPSERKSTERAVTNSAKEGPENETQRILLAVWQEVLGVNDIGIHDNFFELGGDSLLSIRVLARAGKQRLQISADDFFSHPTIAAQAQCASRASGGKVEHGLILGNYPLLSIQRWFFSAITSHPQQWNQSRLFALSDQLSEQVVARALQKLLQHHDVLRTQFTPSDQIAGGWRAEIKQLPAELPLTWVDASSKNQTDLDALLLHESNALNRSLRLDEAPLLRVLYVRTNESNQDRMVIIAHHLVVDAESWRIILEDFSALCASDISAPMRVLPPKSSSYKMWARQMSQFDKAALHAIEEHYQWLQHLPAAAKNLGTEADVIVLEQSISAELTQRFLDESVVTYRCTVQEALLSVFALTLAKCQVAEDIVFEIEGHGRRSPFDHLDVSRTVGWFTCMHPLHYPSLHDPVWNDRAETVRLTKTQLQAAPLHGLGFGLLERREAGAVAEILFNYLGQAESTTENSARLLHLIDDQFGEARAPQCPRAYGLEVNVELIDGALHSQWRGSPALYSEGRLTDLANQFNQQLQALLNEKTATENNLVAADFSLSGLNQSQLDGLADQLDALDDLDD